MMAKKDEVLFTTNLKGLNLVQLHGKSEYLSDEECESLVKQIVDKLGLALDDVFADSDDH